MPACMGSRRFPSRNAATRPTTKMLIANGISRQSTNEIPAASSQCPAGAKGKRRRARIGRKSIAIAGRTNHSVVRGASGEWRPTSTSSMAAIRRSAISPSKTYVRERYRIRVTH
jgi:hypothetical protein